ncbi:MAG: KpsF/GutQ family sugar-phosphate isomerase [Deltaproteobacteria bacterium]|nr:KpsF/GutQ family sugar-phosphate isomerase [Deltaproteobacteria bacterium]
MILRQAREVLRIEAEGILNLIEKLDENFGKMVELILRSKGRTVLTGIGKSGIVARKIVATLISTGTPALFLHPVEAMHGDLGMVSDKDVVIALSNSGETGELNILLPSIKRIGCPLIGFTGNMDSTLARHSDIVIYVGVEREACPMGLAPTASTTAALAMGDALAVALINQRRFKPKDFQRFHPGGNLGQRLSVKVKEIMLTGRRIPLVYEAVTMREVIKEINRSHMGATLVAKKNTTILLGIVTDGDIRRFLDENDTIQGKHVEDAMTTNPKILYPDSVAYDALNIMEKHEITVLPITNLKKEIQGILHLHDILGKGDFKFNGDTIR